MAQSLIALSRDAVSIFYIHMPSTLLMLEDTLAEMNDCHAARQFGEFGLSNFPAWQVVEICQYCQRNGYVMPTVYQGVYNALNRTAEYELIPVPSELRHPLVHPMAPQRAAFSRGSTKRGSAPLKGVDRFGQSRRIRQYEERYLLRDEMFAALGVIRAAASHAGLSTLDAAVRWTQQPLCRRRVPRRRNPHWRVAPRPTRTHHGRIEEWPTAIAGSRSLRDGQGLRQDEVRVLPAVSLSKGGQPVACPAQLNSGDKHKGRRPKPAPLLGEFLIDRCQRSTRSPRPSSFGAVSSTAVPKIQASARMSSRRIVRTLPLKSWRWTWIMLR